MYHFHHLETKQISIFYRKCFFLFKTQTAQRILLGIEWDTLRRLIFEIDPPIYVITDDDHRSRDWNHHSGSNHW